MNRAKDVLTKSRFKGQDVFGFKGQSELYACYRPRYPQSLIDLAVEKAPEKGTVLDVGCGTGILSIPLSKKFERVYGIDISQSQIDKAIEKSEEFKNISYHYQNSHDIGSFVEETMEGKSIDMVTIAQTLHWLDHDLIFKLYKKYLSEGGAFAIFSYAMCSVMNQKLAETISEEASGTESRFTAVEILNFDEEKKYSEVEEKANDAYRAFYSKIKPHFECQRDDIDKHFEHIAFSDYFTTVEQYLKYEVKTLDINSLFQYLKSVSGYRCFLEKFPEETDPLEDLQEELMSLYTCETKEELSTKELDIVYPYHLAILKY
ncbi:unnamed protein product [Moneuplotes crassus]|uniref:Methyltransferase domain-containing protein n=1 Tax=Euplotes crassus TaxID=5936 RepID=A0AAD1XLM2_EUPCR|nr:unnamed protein product [Moneuplotes crassus]